MKKSVITVVFGNVIKKCSTVYVKNISKKRNVEEDVLAFITVYDKDLSPLIYVKQFMRISEKRYDVLRKILWKLAYEDVEDVKEYIKSYIESKKKC